MNCTQARELLPLALYGELNSEIQATLEEHLKGCPGCREEQAALGEVRRLLDAAPAPKLQVNLPALYEEAGRRQAKQLRRWRRAALVLVGAAAVLLVAFLTRLEIRAESHQLVLRWGTPADVGPISNRPSETGERPAPVPTVAPADMKLVRDLLHALATDAQKRDEQWQRNVALLQAEISRLDNQARSRWAATERYVSALHTNQMHALAKGE